jgi:hypothetical protein
MFSFVVQVAITIFSIHIMRIFVTLMSGGIWIPLPLIQPVHDYYDELISTSLAITPLVALIWKNLTRIKYKKLFLMVYLYFTRKAFCSSKLFWPVLRNDMAWIFISIHGMEQMASCIEKAAEAHHSPEVECEIRLVPNHSVAKFGKKNSSFWNLWVNVQQADY